MTGEQKVKDFLRTMDDILCRTYLLNMDAGVFATDEIEELQSQLEECHGLLKDIKFFLEVKAS